MKEPVVKRLRRTHHADVLVGEPVKKNVRKRESLYG